MKGLRRTISSRAYGGRRLQGLKDDDELQGHVEGAHVQGLVEDKQLQGLMDRAPQNNFLPLSKNVHKRFIDMNGWTPI